MKEVDIAKVCHAVNKAYCEALGDISQVDWDQAPSWQQESALNGVRMHLGGDHGPEASHTAWMKEKTDAGWVYGPMKLLLKKEHPCIVPFDQLPLADQAKDYIFKAVVDALKDLC